MTQPFILSIEDDADSREVLRILLCEVMGFSNVQFWPDSAGFIDKLLALPEKPELILMDIRIHPINGYEMLRRLRRHPALKDIRVVAVTASVMEEQVGQLKEDGFNGLIGKPIVRHLFPGILHQILAGESIWYIS